MASSIFESQPHVRPWMLSESRVLLHDKSSQVELQITDLSRDGYASAMYRTPEAAVAALKQEPTVKTRLRIITIAPLNITAPLLEILFSKYGLPAEFADVVASFGEEPNMAEGRSSNASVNTDKNGHGSVSYQARYVELNGRGGEDPWSLRHTGVCHRLKATGQADVIVLLHPVRKPLLEQMIVTLKEDGTRRHKLCDRPVLLHEMLYGCYFDNWRWYMRHLGNRVADKNDLAMVTGPDEIEPNSSFDSVQVVRNTNDNVIFARACCAGNKDLLDRLAHCSAFASLCSALDVHRSKLSGYIESADVLERRIQNLVELIGYTLTLREQHESAEIAKELRDVTERLHKLTEDTVDDSATVRIITFVSAVYLPGSFIATLLGMNLFVFEDDTKKLRVSPDFWIFIVLWLPLTLITGGIYVFIKSRPKSKRIVAAENGQRQRHGNSGSTLAQGKE
ncbi:hypothetical protein E8E12_005570 [Didymella heteroderae]|uniref:Metal ion transmembrane transporter n=1 Tax=Didymella heteroderae TaxID=1769908 RepID=A0A9P4WNE4_9PLEO|nr:hypothetical protein E8E12_005570 [Didymella heteroderae]